MVVTASVTMQDSPTESASLLEAMMGVQTKVVSTSTQSWSYEVMVDGMPESEQSGTEVMNVMPVAMGVQRVTPLDASVNYTMSSAMFWFNMEAEPDEFDCGIFSDVVGTLLSGLDWGGWISAVESLICDAAEA